MFHFPHFALLIVVFCFSLCLFVLILCLLFVVGWSGVVGTINHGLILCLPGSTSCFVFCFCFVVRLILSLFSLPPAARREVFSLSLSLFRFVCLHPVSLAASPGPVLRLMYCFELSNNLCVTVCVFGCAERRITSGCRSGASFRSDGLIHFPICLPNPPQFSLHATHFISLQIPSASVCTSNSYFFFAIVCVFLCLLLRFKVTPTQLCCVLSSIVFLSSRSNPSQSPNSPRMNFPSVLLFLVVG